MPGLFTGCSVRAYGASLQGHTWWVQWDLTTPPTIQDSCRGGVWSCDPVVLMANGLKWLVSRGRASPAPLRGQSRTVRNQPNLMRLQSEDGHQGLTDLHPIKTQDRTPFPEF